MSVHMVNSGCQNIYLGSYDFEFATNARTNACKGSQQHYIVYTQTQKS